MHDGFAVKVVMHERKMSKRPFPADIGPAREQLDKFELWFIPWQIGVPQHQEHLQPHLTPNMF